MATKTSMPRRAAVLVLLGAVFFPSLVVAAQPPVKVIVAPVTTMPFEDRVEALGTLKANESVVLTASVTETVGALHFDDGDRVAAGQLLVEMTSDEEKARLKEARAREQEAQRQFSRVQSLAGKGTASQSQLDERRREWQTARAQLVAIESRLSDLLVRAPFAGVIGLRNISVGALVEPGDQIATLDDDSQLKLDLMVPSVFLPTLVPGLPVIASTAAYGDRKFEGRLRSIDSRVDPVTRSVIARVVLPNPEGLLKPGLLMQATLKKNPRDALVIPEAALMPSGTDQFVLVAEAKDERHKVDRRQVTIGTRRPGLVEIRSGLAEGELVVTHGSMRVRPGQAVEIMARDDGSSSLESLLNGVVGASSR